MRTLEELKSELSMPTSFQVQQGSSTGHTCSSQSGLKLSSQHVLYGDYSMLSDNREAVPPTAIHREMGKAHPSSLCPSSKIPPDRTAGSSCKCTGVL